MAKLYYISIVPNHRHSKKSGGCDHRCKGRDDKVWHASGIEEIEQLAEWRVICAVIHDNSREGSREERLKLEKLVAFLKKHYTVNRIFYLYMKQISCSNESKDCDWKFLGKILVKNITFVIC